MSKFGFIPVKNSPDVNFTAYNDSWVPAELMDAVSYAKFEDGELELNLTFTAPYEISEAETLRVDWNDDFDFLYAPGLIIEYFSGNDNGEAERNYFPAGTIAEAEIIIDYLLANGLDATIEKFPGYMDVTV